VSNIRQDLNNSGLNSQLSDADLLGVYEKLFAKGYDYHNHILYILAELRGTSQRELQETIDWCGPGSSEDMAYFDKVCP